MRKLFFFFLFSSCLVAAHAQKITIPADVVRPTTSYPTPCPPGYVRSAVIAGVVSAKICAADGLSWTAFSTGATGADTALSNLTSVAINTALLPGSVNAIDLGSTTKWFRDAYLGTSGSFYTKFTTTPTANRTQTFPDNSGIVANLNLAQTWSALQTYSTSPTSPGSSSSERWGANASTSSFTNALAVGASATASGNNGTAIGTGANAADLAVAIGQNTAAGSNAVAIGYQATGSASTSIAIGRQSSSTHQASIALGFLATSTATKQFIAGTSTGGFEITDVYIGSGVTNTSPLGVTYNATGGSGTNIAGAALTLAGGKGTGNAVGGSVKLQTSTALTTGTTLQTLVDRMIVNGANKALTDATNIDLFDATLASNSYTGGTVEATIYASDGTDYQTRTVLLTWQAVNKAGTITSSVTVVSETAAVSSGTLTGTWAVTDGSGKITIKLSADSSLTPTVFYVRYIVKNNSEQAIVIL